MTASSATIIPEQSTAQDQPFKVCTICEQNLPSNKFAGWNRVCKSCKAKKRKIRASELQLLKENILTHKTCCKCDECKPVNNFRKSNQTKDGLKTWCRECENLYENARKKSKDFADIDDGRLKICSTCGIPQPRSNFHRSKRDPDGVKGQCRSCRAADAIDYNKRNKDIRKALYPILMLKHEKENTTKICSNKACTFGGLPQPWTRFYKNYYSNDGLQSCCMDCYIERALMKRFNVGRDWYRATLEAQGGKCAICGSTDPKNPCNTFAIDHDHSCCPQGYSCGKCIRGLLCFPCNSRLAHLENVAWKRKAISYLNKHRRDNSNYDEVQSSLFDL